MTTITTATAQDVIDRAPLGAIIRFSDGTPQPPARFKRKLSAWENRNGTGRLTEKDNPGDGQPGQFTLHLGNWGTNEVIIMRINRVYTGESRGSFTVDQVPQSGQALVLNAFMGRDELLHIAPGEEAARTWMEAHGYAQARIEIVAEPADQAAAA